MCLALAGKQLAQKRSWDPAASPEEGSLRKKPWQTFKGVEVRKTDLSRPECVSAGDSALITQIRERLQIHVEGDEGIHVTPIRDFGLLCEVLPEHLRLALVDLGITVPLPLQAQALPIIVRGHDVIAIAATGSGKTFAFLLPAIIHIDAQPPVSPGLANPIALVLTPTRELALQIVGEAAKLCKGSSRCEGGRRIKAAAVYDGGDEWAQLREAESGVHILVATPTRLLDFMEDSSVSLHRTTYLVLDDADRMVGAGLEDALKKIISGLRKDCQLLLFSAEWLLQLESFAGGLCRGATKPVRITVGQAGLWAEQHTDTGREGVSLSRQTGPAETSADQVLEDMPGPASEASDNPFYRAFLQSTPALDPEAQHVVDKMRQEMEVAVEGAAVANSIPPIRSFAELGVLPNYVEWSLMEMGIVAPLPIQSQALPIILRGHDLIGIAKTGSGKTLAFLLPAIVHIEVQAGIPLMAPTPIAVVLAPTRELAVQIKDEAKKIVTRSNVGNHPRGLGAAVVYGGERNRTESLNLVQQGCHILVATPGRLLDHLERGEILLHRVTYFVLDEADRMLEEGFGDQVQGIASKVRKDRHMLFFSATWPRQVQDLAAEMCGAKAPIRLSVGQRESGSGVKARCDIIQQVLVFDQGSWEHRDKMKQRALYAYLRNLMKVSEHKVLVFVSRKDLADQLASQLGREGFYTDAMHGGRSQTKRLEILDNFRRSWTRLLIATDVMGRGLDIPDITHVIIYDMCELEDYVHRIGRTARGVDKQGHALTFFEYDSSRPHLAEGLLGLVQDARQEVPSGLWTIVEEVRRGQRDIRAKAPNQKLAAVPGSSAAEASRVDATLNMAEMFKASMQEMFKTMASQDRR